MLSIDKLKSLHDNDSNPRTMTILYSPRFYMEMAGFRFDLKALNSYSESPPTLCLMAADSKSVIKLAVRRTP
jgi:hypothetical protein